MARNFVPIRQVVNDFIIGVGGDDYVNDASDVVIRNLALRGLREIGFDFMKRIKSIRLSVNTDLYTVDLPEDFVDYTKIGVVGGDGLVYVMGENKNINMSMKYVTDSFGNPVDSDGDGIYDREDGKEPVQVDITDRGYESYIFRNYISENTDGRIYGLGGGRTTGMFRMNYEQNRIEVTTGTAYSDVVIEYIADEARSENPSVHIYAEEAIRAYIYYRLVERKSNVPYNEKVRARTEYYNERRKANARLKAFTKEQALLTTRKNTKQSPKY
jgi:hypothetical protein